MCGYPAVGVAKNLLVVDGLDRWEVRRQLEARRQAQQQEQAQAKQGQAQDGQEQARGQEADLQVSGWLGAWWCRRDGEGQVGGRAAVRSGEVKLSGGERGRKYPNFGAASLCPRPCCGQPPGNSVHFGDGDYCRVPLPCQAYATLSSSLSCIWLDLVWAGIHKLLP